MLTVKSRFMRAALRLLIPFVFFPILAILGSLLFEGKRHLLISLLAACLAVLLFVTGFEQKEIGTRRTVLLSVMIALSVAGRFLPFFKPVTALTIITALYLGGEAGFAVGAFSALLSNFYFGQGPWTPFQMLAWGLIGLAAGYLAKPLRKKRWLLLTFGFLSGFVFSAVMDIWTVLWYHDGFDLSLYLAATVTALPHTLLYAFSNLFFLCFLAKPFGEKLQRIKYKYGI